jgi:hypothetical protein
MNLELTLALNVSRLKFDPVRGRRTLYAKLTLGSNTFWLMRWDTARAMHHKPFAFSRDRRMCWSCGHRS